MAEHLSPSSFRCDCGHQSDFFENTISEMKALSRKRKKPQHLVDSSARKHVIEFVDGRPVAVICPKLGRREIKP
jgi:hypothetical protein